jgi:predicted dehydrogenase
MDDIDIIYLGIGWEKRENILMDLISHAYTQQKMVICSPMALPLSQRRAVLEILDAKQSSMSESSVGKNSRVQLQQAFRCYPAIKRLKEAVVEEKLCGDVMNVDLRLQTNWLHSELDTFIQSSNSNELKENAGHMCQSVIANMIDLLSWVLDSPIVSVTSRFHESSEGSKSSERLNFDLASIQYETENGVFGTIIVAFQDRKF